MNYIEQKHSLIVQKMKLDKFFTMFLDKFEKQMDPDNTNTPIWKLYKTKLKEYDKVSYDIKTTDYWLSKR